MVSKNHPEWVGKDLAHLEFDSIRPDMDTYCLNTTPELDSFFRNYVEEFDEIMWTEILSLSLKKCSLYGNSLHCLFSLDKDCKFL